MMLNHDDGGPRRWRVALVAHDAKKAALAAFVLRHRESFKNWDLLAPGPTGESVREATGLRIRTLPASLESPDVQVEAEIAVGEVDAVIFLRDPLTAQPHESNVAALLRVADVHNVATATNLASAECLVRALRPELALSHRS